MIRVWCKMGQGQGAQVEDERRTRRRGWVFGGAVGREFCGDEKQLVAERELLVPAARSRDIMVMSEHLPSFTASYNSSYSSTIA